MCMLIGQKPIFYPLVNSLLFLKAIIAHSTGFTGVITPLSDVGTTLSKIVNFKLRLAWVFKCAVNQGLT